jgi:hypothetical protein
VEQAREPDDAGFVDDRGLAFNPAPSELLVEHMRPRRAIVALAMRVVGLMALGWLVFSFARSPKLPTVGHLVAVVVVLAFPLLVARLANGGARRRLPSVMAHLAAHCHCGNCGYDLRKLEREGDSCVVCPECGAAWHSDRFVLADQEPKDSETLQKLLSRGGAGESESECDDRGLMLDGPVKWPPRWIDSATTPPDAAARLSTEMQRRRRRWLSIAVPGALVVWAGAVYGLSLINREPLGLIIVVTGLIGLTGLYAITRVYVDRAMLRVPVDDLGLCNNCGRPLPEGSSPAFDGCTVCSKCGRAWLRKVPVVEAASG